MPREALNCIVCGRKLENITDDSDNQPSEGLAYITHGHYGGTKFDPMNGCFLEVNICDVCIIQKADQGQVLMGQDFKRVVAELPTRPTSLAGQEVYMDTIIGRLPVKRELVPWKPGLELQNDDEDVLRIELDEIGSERFPEIEYLPGVVEAYGPGAKEGQDEAGAKEGLQDNDSQGHS